MNKTKLALLVCLTLGIASKSEAAVSLVFDTNGDGTDVGRIYLTEADATAGLTTGRTPIGAIYQIIWSLDNAISPINPLDPLVPTGGDVVIMNGGLNYFTTAYTGRMSESLNLDDSLAGGYIYGRVFGETDVNNIGIGTSYLDAPDPLSGPLVVTTADPLTVNYADMSPGGTHVWLNQTIVPEPSTLAFLGLGGLALAVRRRFVA